MTPSTPIPRGHRRLKCVLIPRRVPDNIPIWTPHNLPIWKPDKTSIFDIGAERGIYEQIFTYLDKQSLSRVACLGGTFKTEAERLLYRDLRLVRLGSNSLALQNTLLSHEEKALLVHKLVLSQCGWTNLGPRPGGQELSSPPLCAMNITGKERTRLLDNETDREKAVLLSRMLNLRSLHVMGHECLHYTMLGFAMGYPDFWLMALGLVPLSPSAVGHNYLALTPNMARNLKQLHVDPAYPVSPSEAIIIVSLPAIEDINLRVVPVPPRCTHRTCPDPKKSTSCQNCHYTIRTMQTVLDELDGSTSILSSMTDRLKYIKRLSFELTDIPKRFMLAIAKHCNRLERLSVLSGRLITQATEFDIDGFPDSINFLRQLGNHSPALSHLICMDMNLDTEIDHGHYTYDSDMDNLLKNFPSLLRLNISSSAIPTNSVGRDYWKVFPDSLQDLTIVGQAATELENFLTNGGPLQYIAQERGILPSLLRLRIHWGDDSGIMMAENTNGPKKSEWELQGSGDAHAQLERRSTYYEYRPYYRTFRKGRSHHGLYGGHWDNECDSSGDTVEAVARGDAGTVEMSRNYAETDVSDLTDDSDFSWYPTEEDDYRGESDW